MGRETTGLYAFNRGEVSKEALGRIDVDRLRLSAETQENWMPYVLGPMMLRPGKEYIGSTKSDAKAKFIPFVFANDDTALLEFTDSCLRVWVDEELVTRPTVSTTVTNGDFSSGTGWVLAASGSGATATVSGGKLNLYSPAVGGSANCKRTLTVAGADQNVEHAFNITVDNGPVIFKAGSADEGEQYIEETYLDTGVHSLAFTPTGASVFIKFETRTAQLKIVDSITIAPAGVMELTSPYLLADLQTLRTDESGDVVFFTGGGKQQRKVERRDTSSWSLVKYYSDNGPFMVGNGTDTTLTPTAAIGNTTLTSSRDLFYPEHVGALFRLFSSGQTNTASLAAQNTFCDAIRVTGVDAARIFNLAVTGTWVGTIRLQRSFDSATSGFTDIDTYTTNWSRAWDDGLDNSIAWYRLGFKTGEYTSGTADVSLVYSGGGEAGICRVTAYTSRTSVSVEVLNAFSSLTATSDWNEGDWSDVNGWPSCVSFFDGRLWWAGRDKIWGSVSDDFTNFDIDTVGDAAPISRSVGSGPVDTINWLMPLSRLLVGRQGSEVSIASSTFNEPLTATNFAFKTCSRQGSYSLAPALIDTRGVFVQQSNRKVYDIFYSIQNQEYGVRDLTRLNLNIGLPGFVGVAAARQPDTNIFLPRADGVCAVLLYDQNDETEAWWKVKTAATSSAASMIEDVVVLPGEIEDKVYFVVKRVINGSTKRFLERMARRDQCTGFLEARLADSHVIYEGSATTTITGLSHLEGETVVVWGWDDNETAGVDLGTKVVTGGQITGLSRAVQNACVGLAYSATFKSAKLAYAASGGAAIDRKKTINSLGLCLINTHYQGVRFGPSDDALDPLALKRDGATVADNTVYDQYDTPHMVVKGRWAEDARLVIAAASPRPATVLCAALDMTTNG